MNVTPPQSVASSRSDRDQQCRQTGRRLMDVGGIHPLELVGVLGESRTTGATLTTTAVRNGLMTPRSSLRVLSQTYNAPVYLYSQNRVDPDISALLSPEYCLQHALIPWSSDGTSILIAMANPEHFQSLKDELTAKLGPVRLGLTLEDDIHKIIATFHAPELATQAETWLDDDESCRDFNRWTPGRKAIAGGFSVLCIGLIFTIPQLFFTALVLLTVINVLATQITKLSALLLIRGRDAVADAAKPNAFPLTSVLVPLLHETDIAGALVKRLSRLTYPKSRLDVALVLEAGDQQTKDTLRDTELPAWMRVIEVPPGTVQTKPRAMNYALKFCRGEIVGIYDAEDAPAPDQLERVVMAFQNAPPQVACVQAILDFYNARANWLSRCFAIEYASWFRVLLPGFTRMGFAVPLGGTSVFFRREALEKVKGWDAHNVTEDADLGIRLARYGYRTQLIDSVTREEANNRCWPWIKQRSRWIKGYMITYLVHMRHPSRLWHQLGTRKFLGFHLIFLTSILQFTLAPMLWSFWLIAAGMSHPVTTTLPGDIISMIVVLFLSTELVSLLVGITAISLSPHTRLLPWVPTLSIYYPLGVVAAYKALYELIVNPFYWDKTMHGKSAPDAIINDSDA